MDVPDSHPNPRPDPGVDLPPATDPVAVAAALIRRASVTPRDAGAQGVLAGVLSGLGLTVHRLNFDGIENLYARIGAGGPHLCFAGHSDVVPAGADDWTTPPFEPDQRDGKLYGRGACDMKGGIAAFVAAAARVIDAGAVSGTLSLLITGDEEGEAVNGTARVLDWMRARGERPDFCLVGEPTCRVALGDTIKIGRRGSLNARLTVRGTQGHAAYPHRADNPVHRMVRVLSALIDTVLDRGSHAFEPSSLQVTSVDVGNPAANVIPARAGAAFNIRFNDAHTGTGLEAWLRETIGALAPDYDLEVRVSGEAFATQPGPALSLLAQSVGAGTGMTPVLDTGGGTSDARFIAALCPVAEFGLVGASMHKVDEHAATEDLERLTGIYQDFMLRFWAGAAA
jgi:succinyl-diaminopimelate desuccinylase